LESERRKKKEDSGAGRRRREAKAEFEALVFAEGFDAFLNEAQFPIDIPRVVLEGSVGHDVVRMDLFDEMIQDFAHAAYDADLGNGGVAYALATAIIPAVLLPVEGIGKSRYSNKGPDRIRVNGGWCHFNPTVSFNIYAIPVFAGSITIYVIRVKELLCSRLVYAPYNAVPRKNAMKLFRIAHPIQRTQSDP